jgi:hypothetical protein
MEKFNSAQHVALRRIADALGVSVEHFFMDAPPANPIANAGECLRLWSEIKTPEGRLQALEALRLIVEMEQR